MRGTDDEDDERPRWRDPDGDDDEPREWEIEPEEEKEDRAGVLGRSHGPARVVFALLVLAFVAGGLLALIRALREHY